MKKILLAVSLLIFLAGCSGTGTQDTAQEGTATTDSSPEVSEQPQVDAPPYSTTKDEACPIGSLQARCVSASTDATSGEDFNAMTSAVRGGDESTTVIATYYPNEPMAESSGTGFYFPDEAAAREILGSMSPNADPGFVDGQVNEAMGADGFFAISIEDMIREITEAMEATG